MPSRFFVGRTTLIRAAPACGACACGACVRLWLFDIWVCLFYVIAGEVEFTCSGNTVVCPPGTLVHVPAGTVHSCRYLADGCDVLEFTGQGGIATRMFTAVSRAIATGPPEIPKLLEVLKQNGVTVEA